MSEEPDNLHCVSSWELNELLRKICEIRDRIAIALGIDPKDFPR